MIILPYKTSDPIERRPIVTYVLIGLNVLFFLLLLPIGADTREIVFMDLGFVTEEWLRVHTFLTSMFLHAGWLHLVSNMYFLWIFGRNVEDKLGTWKYLLLYLGAGIGGSIVHGITIPKFLSDIPCVGASGAISGVLGTYLVLAPTARLDCFYLWILFLRPLYGLVGLPAVVFLGGWFVGQVMYGLSVSSMAGAIGVAFWAHIGGFLFGAIGIGGPMALRRTREMLARRQLHNRMTEALAAIRKERWPKAAALLDELRKTPMGSADMDLLLARVRSHTDAPAKAALMAKAELASSVNAADRPRAINAYYLWSSLEKRPAMPARVYLALASGFRAFNKIQHAIGFLLESLRRLPGDERSDLVLYEMADIYLGTGDSGRARDILDLLLRLYPQSKLRKPVEWRLKEMSAPCAA